MRSSGPFNDLARRNTRMEKTCEAGAFVCAVYR
jgi:hypothetical protein